MNMNRRAFGISALALLLSGTTALAQDYYRPNQVVAQTLPSAETAITASGSGFAKSLYNAWNDAFFKGRPGLKYESIGSSGGVSQFSHGQVQMGASDVPMTDDQIKLVRGSNADVIQIPTAYGGIVVTYNLPELGDQPLNLTGEQLAAIYLGKVRRWNDPMLLPNNPQLAGVNRGIITFSRADGSGTTFGFTSFLNANSKEWTSQEGAADFSVTWPVSYDKPNNAAIVKGVTDNPYSIGYADFADVAVKKMPMASLRNSDGQYVQPNATTIANAVTKVAENAGSDLRLKLNNASGRESYPMVTATYLIVHQHQANEAKAKQVRDFLNWALKDGQSMSEGLFYVPVPAVVADKASRLVGTIDGSPAAKR